MDREESVMYQKDIQLLHERERDLFDEHEPISANDETITGDFSSVFDSVIDSSDVIIYENGVVRSGDKHRKK